MMIIRELHEKDVDQVYRIECDNFKQPWTKAALLGEIESERSHYLVAELKDEIAGYVGFWKIFDEGHITNIAVDRKYQNKGIGSQLVEGILSLGVGLGIHKFTLEVRVGNAAAIALYKKYGFESVGIRKGFYDLPKEDAMIMWRE